MPAEVKEQIRLEVAHVLFIDIVGYSKLSINEQRTVVDELTRVVRGSDQYQKAEAAGRLIKIPTGDGMALVFYTSQEAPAQCAVEISRALKEHPRLQVRMGVHDPTLGSRTWRWLTYYQSPSPPSVSALTKNSASRGGPCQMMPSCSEFWASLIGAGIVGMIRWRNYDKPTHSILFNGEIQYHLALNYRLMRLYAEGEKFQGRTGG